MLESIVKVVTGRVGIRGATDGAEIGNVDDRLKVISISDVSTSDVYSIQYDITAATAGSDNPLFLIRNPNGSGKILRFQLISGGSSTANVSATLKMYSNPTVTNNGTTRTIYSRNVGGSSPASIALATSIPTVSAAGVSIESVVQGQNSNTVGFLSMGFYAVYPNNAALLTCDPSSNNRLVRVTMVWAETAL